MKKRLYTPESLLEKIVAIQSLIDRERRLELTRATSQQKIFLVIGFWWYTKRLYILYLHQNAFRKALMKKVRETFDADTTSNKEFFRRLRATITNCDPSLGWKIFEEFECYGN